MNKPHSQSSRLIPTLLSLTAVVLGVAWFWSSYRGPDVVPADSPLDQFSAERAIKVFQKVLGPEVPHVAGSPENAAVRDRLIGELKTIGCETTSIDFSVAGVQMTNVLGVIKGQQDLRPILLATHYDSVRPGPGVGDAGSCVAALLECARIIKLQSDAAPLSRDVCFLLTDGEEWVPKIGHGLNGAMHFASENGPLLQRSPIILNFDARGASGPSLLYETGAANQAFMETILPALPRPAFTGSSFVSIYELLPNATDFTIFKQHVPDGVNFAFIGRPDCYHTAEDNFESLDLKSVQHHGNNALAITRELLQTERDDFTSDSNAVFFSIGSSIVCYPGQWAVPLAVTLLVVQLIGTFRSLKHKATAGECCMSAAAIVLTAVGAGALGYGLSRLNLMFDPANGSFTEHEPLVYFALWVGTLLLSWLLIGALPANVESVWTTVWLGNAIVGLLIAIFLPGASYFNLFAGLVPAVFSCSRINRNYLTCASIVAASLVLIPLGYQINLGLGIRMGTVVGPVAALILAPFCPLFASPWNTDSPTNAA